MPSPSGKNVRAGGAFVEFFAKDGALDASLRSIGAKLKNFGASASMTGAAVSAVGAVAAAPFAMGIRTFANFEQGMANVRALTKATDEQFQTLTETARRLGKETKYTAREASDAMYVFAMAGMQAEKIAQAVGPALNLAAAGDIGIAEAADITMKVMAGMGIEAENLGHTIDVLAKAQATANTNMSQLGQAMKYVAPTAKQANYSLEDTLAAVQLLSNAGQQADMAGTSLSGGIMSLTQPSKEAAETLNRLGVRVRDANGDMMPLADIIDDLNAGLDGLGSADKLRVIGQIFDARQARGFAELISQGGQALRDASAALQASEGEAARIAEIKMNTIEGRAEIAKSALDDMFITIGKIFAEPVKKAIEAVTFLINKTTEWIDAHHQVVRIASLSASVLVVVGGAITSLGLASVAAGMAFNGLNNVFRATITVTTSLYRATRILSLFNALSAGAGLLSTAIATLTGVTTMAGVAFSVMSQVMILVTSPLGLVVAAVAAAVYWWDDLYAIAMTFADQVGAAVEVTGGIIWGVMSSIGEVFGAVGRTIYQFVTTSEYLQEVWGRVLQLYSIVAEVVSTLGTVLSWVGTAAANTINVLWSIVQAGAEVVSSIYGAVRWGLGQVVSFIANIANSIASYLLGMTVDVLDSIAWAVGQVGSFLIDTAMSVLGWIGRTIADWAAPLTAVVTDVYDVLSAGFIGFAKAFHSMFTGLWKGIFSFVASAPSAMSSAFSAITSYLGSIYSAAGSVGGELLGWMNGVFAQISTLFSDLSAIAGETFTAIQTAITNGNWEAAGNALWAALKLAWVKGVSVIGAIWRTASGEVVETWRGTVDILSLIWAGLFAGIESKLAAAQNKTASWIIEAQRMAGVLTDEEAAGAQAELTAMGEERQKRISAQQSAAQSKIEAEAEKRREAARQADATSTRASAAAMAQAQAEYEAAMKEAMAAKPEPKEVKDKSGKPVATQNLKKLDTTLAPMVANTGGGGGGITLSAFASRMMGGGDNYAERTAKATEATAKYIKDLDENMATPDHLTMGV